MKIYIVSEDVDSLDENMGAANLGIETCWAEALKTAMKFQASATASIHIEIWSTNKGLLEDWVYSDNVGDFIKAWEKKE